MRDIIFFGHRHFNTFVTEENISTNILTDRLTRLISHGILRKDTDPKNKSAFIYSLTKRGLGLVPVVIEILNWGASWMENHSAPEPFVKRLIEDKQGVIRDISITLKREHDVED